MRRIAPLLVVLLLLVACSDSEEDASPASTTESADAETGIETDTETADPGGDGTGSEEVQPTTTASSTTTQAEGTTPETTAAPPTEDETGRLCSSYLEALDPSGFEQGLAGLAEVLGDDAPVGVLEAIDVLQSPGDDVEAFFRARNSIDTYVLPVCDERFRSGITPRSDNGAAADAFVAAVRDGDRATAEGLAPTNVIVQFDWVGYPQATADFDPDNTTLSMVVEPTVSVFCQLAGGSIEFCAFGE